MFYGCWLFVYAHDERKRLHMIGFSIMMFFCSVIIITLSISLLKGNYSGIHGKVFDNTKDKKGYAKALGKPALLLGTGTAIAGILTIVIHEFYSIIIAVIFLLLLIIIAGLWFVKLQKRF